MVLYKRGFLLTGAISLLFLAGCQMDGAYLHAPRSPRIVDGLGDAGHWEPLHLSAAIPAQWQKLNTQHGLLYIHQQWRSPSKMTGVGVVFARSPMPLKPSMLIWMAKQEYAKKDKGGKLIAQWTDPWGREWFEAENAKYHVRGYAVTHGLDAWIVYCGYRTTAAAQSGEIELANRSMMTFAPDR